MAEIRPEKSILRSSRTLSNAIRLGLAFSRFSVENIRSRYSHNTAEIYRFHVLLALTHIMLTKQTVRELLPSINLTMTNDNINITWRKEKKAKLRGKKKK